MTKKENDTRERIPFAGQKTVLLPGERIIDTTERVPFTATDKHPNHPEGFKGTCAPILKAHFIKLGYVVDDSKKAK